MKPAHYCTNPACQLCRGVDLFRNGREDEREDIASGNVWPEGDDEDA